jgi:hypothetical protein
MFLQLLCLGKILAPRCPASCQPSSSPPFSSGSIGAASFHPFSRSTKAPMPFCSVVPAPSPSESGHGTRSSPSAALRPALQRMPRLAAHVAVADRRVRTQVLLPQPNGFCFQTCWFLHLFPRPATKWSRNRFPTWQGGFSMPGTGSACTASTDTVPIPSAVTAQEVRPLTSSLSSRGQSLGGALWRATYTPGDGQTSLAYSSNPVHYQ